MFKVRFRYGLLALAAVFGLSGGSVRVAAQTKIDLATQSKGTLPAAQLPATVVRTDQSNTFTVGTQDASGAAHTLPLLKGTIAAMPVGCSVSEEYFATNAVAGQNEFYCTAPNVWTQEAGGSSGVTSVGMTVPTWLAVTPGTITTSGTFALTAAAAQTQNQFLATPNGASGAVALRTIVAADVPTLNQSTTGTALNVTGIVVPANGGTGVASPSAHQLFVAEGSGNFTAVPAGSNGQVLESGGAGVDPTFQDPIVSGPDAPGVAPTKNPVQIGGFDGTNVQRVKTDINGYIGVNVQNGPSVTQGTAAAASGAWPAKVTDGTNVAAVKAASTAAAATDPALVVAVSPNNSVAVTGTFWQATQPVSGTFWQATQPVSGTVSANQGTANTATNAWPAKVTDGTNVASVKAASTAAAATDPALVVAVSPNNSVAVTGTFFQATQPVSGTVTADQGTANTAANAWTAKVTDGTNVAAVKAASTAAVAADPSVVVGLSPNSPLPTGSNTIGALTANQSVNINQVGATAASATAKGTQATNGIGVQELKDSGRTYVVGTLLRATGVTTEALGTVNWNKAGTNTAATTYTVTSAKTLRIQHFFISCTQTSGTAAVELCAARLRSAASCAASSNPIGVLEASMPSATLQTSGQAWKDWPDGLEIAAGQQICVSHVENATTGVITIGVSGFEY